jgi:hypothetical protein
MPSRRLSPRTKLDVALSATITRNLLVEDPSPVIAQLRALAGEDVELLAQVAGECSGYYDSQETRPLCDALAAEIEGAGPRVMVGRERRARGVHGPPRDY